MNFFIERIIEMFCCLKAQLPSNLLSQAKLDAKECLNIDEREFYRLAYEWKKLGKELWNKSNDPMSYYAAYDGLYGKSIICANILDQLKRKYIFTSLQKYVFQGCVLLDFGCSTATLSFSFIKDTSKSCLLDIANLPQKFLRWRCIKYLYTNVIVEEPEYLAKIPGCSIDICMCIDVLEHITDPTQTFILIDSKLRKGGILLLRAPFGYRYDHLRIAEKNWIHGGGRDILNKNYQRLSLSTYRKLT